MRAETIWHEDMWKVIKRCTMTTISKDSEGYPTSEWKTKLLRAKHSPIRIGKIIVKLYDIPSYVATHLVRHHIGVEKFVSTRRSDRGFENEVIDRNSPVDMVMDLNFEAIMNISKKRLCTCADATTIKVWKMVLEEVKKYEPELYYLCVKECVCDGYCPEFKSCGYADTEQFELTKEKYRAYNGEWNE